MDDKMRDGSGKPGVGVRLEQGLELLADAFANAPLAETVAAGDVERRHQ